MWRPLVTVYVMLIHFFIQTQCRRQFLLPCTQMINRSDHKYRYENMQRKYGCEFDQTHLLSRGDQCFLIFLPFGPLPLGFCLFPFSSFNFLSRPMEIFATFFFVSSSWAHWFSSPYKKFMSNESTFSIRARMDKKWKISDWNTKMQILDEETSSPYWKVFYTYLYPILS